jgi:hypothetical protein
MHRSADDSYFSTQKTWCQKLAIFWRNEIVAEWCHGNKMVHWEESEFFKTKDFDALYLVEYDR